MDERSKCRCACPQTSGLPMDYLRTSLKPLMKRSLTGVVLFVVVLWNSCATLATAQRASIPSLQPADVKSFRHYDEIVRGYAEHYRYLNIVNNQLYIGAMNYVIRINADDISRSSVLSTKRLNESTYFEQYQGGCRATHMSTMDYDCQNHIRAIIPRDDGMLEVCGTSAYTPRKFIIDPNNMKEDVQLLYQNSERGLAICPPNPDDSCTVLYVRDGNPGNEAATYSGTMMDFTKADPVFYRPRIAQSNLLRTVKDDEKLLNEPHFVQSFDVGEYVYFFFRESAIEYMNCGKAIYSRVARVCKKDRGGDTVLGSRFTTFFKARLNCSIPGDYPFYFNELYDVFKIGQVFYGLFRTNNIGLTGSAICAFNNDDISQAFHGAFKEQTESSSKWLRVPEKSVPHPRPTLCSENSKEVPDNVLQFTKAHPLMDESVKTESGQPTFFKQEVNYTKIAVQKVRMYTVYYLATDAGEIHKVVSWDGGSKTITTWKDFTTNNLPIHQMTLHNEQLYISTDHEVLQLPVNQCAEYKYCTQCIQDPHCGWDDWEQECRNYRHGFKQNVTAEIPEETCSNACKHVGVTQHVVKVHGHPVHLHCTSLCEPSKDIVWRRGNGHVIQVDNKKYFQTVDNGLIVFNASRNDAGQYRCVSESITMAEHQLSINDCDDPKSCWEHEFSKWCQEFDTYEKEMKEWQCLRDKCVGDPQCIPELHTNECRRTLG